MPQHSPRGIAEVAGDVLPAGHDDLTDAAGHGGARRRPCLRAPHGRTVPHEDSPDGPVLRLGELGQRGAGSGHLVGDDRLEVEHGGALGLEGLLRRLDLGQRRIDLLQDRRGRLGRVGGVTRLAPRPLHRGHAVQRLLEEGGPLGEHVQPRGRLELPPLPQLLLGLQGVQRRLALKNARGERQVQVDLLADLGEALADRLDLRTRAQRLDQDAEEIRHLCGSRRDLFHRNRHRR